MEIRVIDREAVLWLVQGLKDFEKDKAIRGGLSAATLVFKTIGRNNLRKRMKNPNGVTGNLLSSFTNRVKRSKPGALSGFEWPKGAHVWLVDQGTMLRQTKRHNTGIMPALHFWEDARSQGESRAMQRLYQGVERAIQLINNRQR